MYTAYLKQEYLLAIRRVFFFFCSKYSQNTFHSCFLIQLSLIGIVFQKYAILKDIKTKLVLTMESPLKES